MTRRHLPGAALVLLAIASIATPGDAGGLLTFVLGPDGVVYSWTAGDADLSPLPPSLARLAGHPVNDLAIAEDGGKVVVLPVASRRTGTHRARLEGSAVVISSPTTVAPPAILNEIPFEGDGRRLAVSRDGRFAYVLVIVAGPDPAGGVVRARLCALDLEEGRVLASAQLDRPPSAMALDPAGTRLYLGYAGRIQTFTTHPLAQSWHYRSPGTNRGLCFRPHGVVLYSARRDQIALFDPEIIAGRKPEERLRLQDDATTVIPLPFAADSLLFSRDGTHAATSGPGKIFAFFEPGTGTIVTASVDGADSETRQEVRPFYFIQGPGDLVVAIFPEKQVQTIPSPASLIQAATASTSKISSSTKQISSDQSSPAATADTRAPEAAPPPIATPTPTPIPAAAGPSEARPVLAGRLSGRIDAVRAIVMYGPGSIVREQARAAPDADGSWRIPLPAPGVYRIVPLGDGSRPVRSEPNFHTLDVKDRSVTGLDFRILGTS